MSQRAARKRPGNVAHYEIMLQPFVAVLARCNVGCEAILV